MWSDVEEGDNLMLTRLTPVATLLATHGSRRHKTLRERFDTMYQWFLTGPARHHKERQ